MFGLYVHVPFCSALCPYCDFAVVVGRANDHGAYLEAVVREAAASDMRASRGTVFVGGGTPSFVDASLLAGALARVVDAVGLRDISEFSVEVNPETVATEGLKVLRDVGVDRVSIGAQSFDDGVLHALGRTHDAAQIPRAVDTVRDAGIENVSLDLIYGTGEETDESWTASLTDALRLEPQHVSCYALTIEERTPFGSAVARGAMQAPDDDAQARRFEIACNVLDAAGFHHYEISNWARAGYECAHNINYWTQGDYLGLGLGAHSHRAGTRWWNTRSLSDYLRGSAEVEREVLTDAQRADESISLRIRLLDGLEIDDPTDTRALEEAGLATVDGRTLRLTRKGMLLENEVTARLLESSGNRSRATTV